MKRLLVIEDDLDIRETEELVLFSRGYEVIGAGHGRAAIDVCRQRAARPDVILLDLMMPVMDGWEFLERQRQEPLLDGVPVIIISAQPVDQPLPPTVVGVMKKPVTVPDLIDAIERASSGAVAA